MEQEKRRQIIQIVFLIVVIIAIGVMIAAIITIHNYADMLSNPLGYSLAKLKIDSCTCVGAGKMPFVVEAINSTA